ncbi:acyl-CoA dehydrogenase family protein [Glutamicibacter sp. NPDC087344]|uniref:acyl-CoA dehydrogenase family protein n=1 Tax=Glutamicibacter sp. NPDC087344 TaxID=3363994 RepID=UPI0038036D91
MLRGHIAHVEHLLLRPQSAHREKWLHRIGAGDIVGNAASERTELTEITTVLEENNGTLSVSGTKYYTTGSLYADWISLSALHGEQRVNLLVSASDPGVSIRDDWDGFGQQLTASGSLTLEGVLVDAADVQVFELSDPHTAFRAALFQGILLFVAAGIAQNAVDDAVAFIKPRRRTFAVFGETIPAEQEIVQTTLGESAAKAYSAASIVLHLAGEFERYTSSQGAALSAEALALDTFKAQQVVLKLATDTATEIFEVGGASATSLSRRLDRHWRNARTVASHNPAKYRARLIGEQLLTGNFSLYSTRP